MMFDNTPQEPTSTWTNFKDHLPVILMIVGVVGLFISLHTAAYTVAGLAVGHVVIGVGLFAIKSVRRRRGTSR